MSEPRRDSVRRLLADLHAHRVLTMNPADLQVNIDQRQELVDTADYAGFVKPGDRVPDFTLDEVGGETLTRDGLLAGGPAVLVFFRFAGCPACNIALPYYQRQLWPGLAALGVPLIAVSPQVPEKLIEIKARHDLPFLVATDPGNALARHFGILYSANAASRTLAAAKGYEIGEITGTGTWELPMPTVVVIDRDGIVRFADVAPDWLKRTETEPVLDAVRGLAIAAAA